MAIPLEEYDEINSQTPKGGKGDELELSETDERVLDKVWAKVSEKNSSKAESAVF